MGYSIGLFTLLGAVITLMQTAIVGIGNLILNDAIEMFSGDVNFFAKLLDLIPFASEIHLASIIKACAIGIILVLLIVQIMRSMSSSLTGENTINPVQAVIRAAIAVALITAFYGVDAETFESGGLLGILGNWFGALLNALGSVPEAEFHLDFLSVFSPGEYMIAIIIEIAILINVVTAAATYIERLVCFAIYTVIGPVAIAMYANKSTESNFGNWAMGLVSQFLAVFISLMMWIMFVMSMNQGYTSLFNLIVSLSLLGIMKNSEKILAPIGLRAMNVGDTGRAISAGAGVAIMAARMGGRAVHSSGSHTSHSSSNSINNRISATGSPYGVDGKFGGDKLTRVMQQVDGSMRSINPLAVTHSINQNKAIKAVQSATVNGDQVSSKVMNTAMGFSQKGNIRIEGHGANNTLSPATLTTASGQTVKGYMGDITKYSSTGEVKRVSDVFISTSGEPLGSVNPGDQIMVSGEERPRYISGNGVSLDENNMAYRTELSFKDIAEKHEAHVSDVEGQIANESDLKDGKESPVQEINYPAGTQKDDENE